MLKNTVKRGIVSVRASTSGLRLLPDFLIIGAQRSGTTSLYNYLTAHPSIGHSLWKEVHYFDVNFQKGLSWYKAHFPTKVWRWYRNKRGANPYLVGESSPYYLFHPHAAKRAYALVPDARLIALLRDPVERAYSHYLYEVRKEREKRPFEQAIRDEKEIVSDETNKILTDGNHISSIHQRFSYLSRGEYEGQLKRWNNFFPRDKILVLSSEDLFRDPRQAMITVFRFLGLSPKMPLEFERFGSSKKLPMSDEARGFLREYFRSHNERLYNYLGRHLGWQ